MFSQYKIIKYPIQINKTIQMTNQTYLTHHQGRIQSTWFGVRLHTPHLITAKETEEGSEVRVVYG